MTQLLEVIGDTPAWDKADRMRKALRHSGVSVQQMAAYLGVSRRSVGNWISGRIQPSVQTLRLWAMRTGVSYVWLCHDDEDECVSEEEYMTGSAFTVAPLVAAA